MFPGKSKKGHLTEPKKQVFSVAERSGVPFTLHDLRRTFVTLAESMDISIHVIKKLVNHSGDRVDKEITLSYIITDTERLRKPMQTIENRLLSLCQIEKAKKK